MNNLLKLAAVKALRRFGPYNKPLGVHNLDDFFASQGSGKSLSNINLRRPGRKNLATRINNLENRGAAVDRLNPTLRGQPDAKSQVFGYDSGSTRGAQDFGGTGNWHRTELAGGPEGTIRPLMENQRTFVDGLRSQQATSKLNQIAALEQQGLLSPELARRLLYSG